MSHSRLINDRYLQGQAAYRAGHHIKDLHAVSEDMEKLHDNPELTTEQHNDLMHGAQSLFIGFADALIDDIRLIAQRRNLRA
jgi:hypothetical protein